MTKEEFREGLFDLIEEIKDPDGEIHSVIKDIDDLTVELRAHDPGIATRMAVIVGGFKDLRDYIRSRAEV